METQRFEKEEHDDRVERLAVAPREEKQQYLFKVPTSTWVSHDFALPASVLSTHRRKNTCKDATGKQHTHNDAHLHILAAGVDRQHGRHGRRALPRKLQELQAPLLQVRLLGLRVQSQQVGHGRGHLAGEGKERHATEHTKQEQRRRCQRDETAGRQDRGRDGVNNKAKALDTQSATGWAWRAPAGATPAPNTIPSATSQARADKQTWDGLRSTREINFAKPRYPGLHLSTFSSPLPRLCGELHERRHHEAAGAGIPKRQPRGHGAQLGRHLQGAPRSGSQASVLAQDPRHHLHQLFLQVVRDSCGWFQGLGCWLTWRLHRLYWLWK